jgi:hypothetical protein
MDNINKIIFDIFESTEFNDDEAIMFFRVSLEDKNSEPVVASALRGTLENLMLLIVSVLEGDEPGLSGTEKAKDLRLVIFSAVLNFLDKNEDERLLFLSKMLTQN